MGGCEQPEALIIGNRHRSKTGTPLGVITGAALLSLAEVKGLKLEVCIECLEPIHRLKTLHPVLRQDLEGIAKNLIYICPTSSVKIPRIGLRRLARIVSTNINQRKPNLIG